jgi:hypothetical protein
MKLSFEGVWYECGVRIHTGEDEGFGELDILAMLPHALRDVI